MTATVLQFRPKEPTPVWHPELGAYVRKAIWCPRRGETTDQLMARVLTDCAPWGICFDIPGISPSSSVTGTRIPQRQTGGNVTPHSHKEPT